MVEHFQFVSVVQCVILSADYSHAVLSFVNVGMERGFDNWETRGTLDPIVTHFAEKTCVVNPFQIILEYDLMLNLLKPFPQDLHCINLLKHFIPAYRVHCRPLLTDDRIRPLPSGKKFIMPQKLVLWLN